MGGFVGAGRPDAPAVSTWVVDASSRLPVAGSSCAVGWTLAMVAVVVLLAADALAVGPAAGAPWAAA